MGADLDVVYIVGPGDDNDMLRHSLRSLANLPHRDVWIVGHLPSWVHGVAHLPGNRGNSKPQNVFDNVRLACTIDDLGDRFVMMNDDFFIMEPNPRLDLRWRSSLAGHIESINVWSEWKQSLIATLTHLRSRGFADPLSYELHVPLLTHRAAMAEATDAAAWFSPLYPPQWRTIYGNAVGGGTQALDVKVKKGCPVDPAAPLLSCYPAAWDGHFGAHIRATFPDPSPYEKEARHEDDRSQRSPLPARGRQGPRHHLDGDEEVDAQEGRAQGAA